MTKTLRSHSPPRVRVAQRFGGGLVVALLLLVMSATAIAQRPADKGEPAEDFLKRLRNAGYFEIAISYLDRLNEYPGVKQSLIEAISLEKAQTYIDAAVAAQSIEQRDDYFQKAEASLSEFLKQESHPRVSEARLQLGKLQIVRADQLLLAESDDGKSAARQSFSAAANTFDSIVEDLRGKLKEMQGQKIDEAKEPELVALRKQYRGEFLEAMLSAGNARRLAAGTFDDPAAEGKKLLEEAIEVFDNLTTNYDSYVTGAIARLHLGQAQQSLGQTKEATDSFLRFLEQDDIDPLRDSRFQATSGLIRIWLVESPPSYKQAIERGQSLIDSVRMNEKRETSVLMLKLDLAKAYLAQAKDKEQKSADQKRAESNGRQLLIEIEKLPGQHAEEAAELLKGLGIAVAEVELPKAEPPKSLDDAVNSGRELLQAAENMKQAIALLEQQGGDSEESKAQLADLATQLQDAQLTAIQILQQGIAMIGPESDLEALSQARQFLAYLLLQEKRYRDAAVVGKFLAATAPGTDTGLKGGLIALNAFQMLLAEVPDDENANLVTQVQQLGNLLTKSWPDEPQAAAAQGIMIRLALQKDQWGQAKTLIAKMPEGPEQSGFKRLMGRLLWNQSIMARREENEQEANRLLSEAETELHSGLQGITGERVEDEGMQAALVLAKVYSRQGDNKKAIATLDNEKYGPIPLAAKRANNDDKFLADLYSTELNILVGRMTDNDGDPAAMLARATKAMEKLRESFKGPEGQRRLTQVYIGMANNLKEELDSASDAKRAKLIEAFRVFLSQIAKSSNDPATLQWIIQTLVQLGEAAMPPNSGKATDQAAQLLETAVETYAALRATDAEVPLSIDYQLARAQRLRGNFKNAIDSLEGILKQNPMMLDAQVEAALAYEKWAAVMPANLSPRAYQFALSGARPGPDKKNVIWGWGRISQLTNGKDEFKEVFFNARYHVALSRFLWGRAAKDTNIIKKSETDITMVASLYPELGGPEQRAKFHSLLQQIQKEIGKPATGLPPLN